MTVKIGVLTRNESAWCSSNLKKALEARGVTPFCFWFRDVKAGIGVKPRTTADGVDLSCELDGIIVRPIGRGSLDECIFRLDVLHRLERAGLTIVNSPSAIERVVDKYYALTLLEERGIPVPRTVVTEDPDMAQEAFELFGGDVIVKPVFGSRGIGMTRVTDREVAFRVFRTLSYYRHVIYVQEFIQHGEQDVRALVVGDRVVASMRRVGSGWKTNVSQGAVPEPYVLDQKQEMLAVDAAKAIGCEIAGVDILEGEEGPLINEVNGQPGWRGLQSTTRVDIAGAIADHVLALASGRER